MADSRPISPFAALFIRTAIQAGMLVEEDPVLDDDPDSPTQGKYFMTYRSTTPEPDPEP